MKKFTVLFLACMLFGVNVCNAELFYDKDDFTGGMITISAHKCDTSINVVPEAFRLTVVQFIQTNTPKVYDYRIGLTVRAFHQFGLSKNPLEININGDFSATLDVYKREILKSTKGYFVDYQAPKEIIDKIKTANRVALKFTRNDGSQFVFVLPENVLAEWKEVIAMEK